jgi:N-hydroxyarylamine O-acetyltransferase
MPLNLDAYLARIGYTGPVACTRDALFGLHAAHASSIPFENLDIQMGLPIRLELGAVEEKLVRRRRGGYCFEQNTLFRAALEAFGFSPVMREARVRFGAPTTLPRTHGVHILTLDGEAWLVDVGFGGEGLLHPVRTDGSVSAQPQGSYRVVTEGRRSVLQSQRPEGWFDLYALEPEPVLLVDWEMGNHYTSTYPESRFIASLTVQMPTAEARHVLRGTTYTVSRRGQDTVRELSSRAELLVLLKEVFGLELPQDARFRALPLD